MCICSMAKCKLKKKKKKKNINKTLIFHIFRPSKASFPKGRGLEGQCRGYGFEVVGLFLLDFFLTSFILFVSNILLEQVTSFS